MAIEKIREGLYIKSDRFGTRVVYPIKNEDGTTNWFNVLTGGSWGKLSMTLLIVAIVLLSVWSYNHDVAMYKDVAKNPCEYCPFAQMPIDAPVNMSQFGYIDWGKMDLENNTS